MICIGQYSYTENKDAPYFSVSYLILTEAESRDNAMNTCRQPWIFFCNSSVNEDCNFFKCAKHCQVLFVKQSNQLRSSNSDIVIVHVRSQHNKACITHKKRAKYVSSNCRLNTATTYYCIALARQVFLVKYNSLKFVLML